MEPTFFRQFFVHSSIFSPEVSSLVRFSDVVALAPVPKGGHVETAAQAEPPTRWEACKRKRGATH